MAAHLVGLHNLNIVLCVKEQMQFIKRLVGGGRGGYIILKIKE